MGDNIIMTSSSVYIRDVDFIVYDAGYHDRLFDSEEDMFAEINGKTLPEVLEYYSEMKCIAIYDFGQPIFEDLDDYPALREHIGNNNLFSGVVIVPMEDDSDTKIGLYQLNNIKDAMKELGHCACIGTVYAMRFEHNCNFSILTVFDDTESK